MVSYMAANKLLLQANMVPVKRIKFVWNHVFKKKKKNKERMLQIIVGNFVNCEGATFHSLSTSPAPLVLLGKPIFMALFCVLRWGNFIHLVLSLQSLLWLWVFSSYLRWKTAICHFSEIKSQSKSSYCITSYFYTQ